MTGCVGSSGWPIFQSWGMVVKEGFPKMMPKPRPEGLMGVRQKVRGRMKKEGNARPQEQHVHRLRGRTKQAHASCGAAGGRVVLREEVAGARR